MVIGIPKAFLYFRYRHLWESFFGHLGINTIVSPDTNKEIVSSGMNYAVDESCLSSKIYLGHVAWLLGKCDYILVPRIDNFGKEGIVCTKFQAIYDIVRSTFKEQNCNLLHYNIDVNNAQNELNAFLKMGQELGIKWRQTLSAYVKAKLAERNAQLNSAAEQNKLLSANKLKILLIAHQYNFYDRYIGFPIVNALRRMDVEVIFGGIADRREALAYSVKISETLPWVFNKELLGSVGLYHDKVDGIILMSAFPCGPDSLVNDIILRKIKDKPILNLLLDGQEGTAGLQTRLESFIDIIQFKREAIHG